MRICVGLASGIGNTLFALPCLQALHAAGHDVTLWVEGDYPGLVDLWRRCVYVQDVCDGRRPGVVLPPANVYVSGPWIPRSFRNLPDGVRWYRWTTEGYPEPEWALFARAAKDLGCPLPASPNVFHWCRDLRVTERIDVGIVQGSKPGPVWARKRYAGMPDVATALQARGYAVAWFGTLSDEPPPAGIDDRRGRYALQDVPDALAGCRLVVGTDSGMTHLAASLGVPIVGVFTATSAIKGQPLSDRWTILQTHLPCQPCQGLPAWQACRQWECQQIAPAEVVQAVEEWLR